MLLKKKKSDLYNLFLFRNYMELVELIMYSSYFYNLFQFRYFDPVVRVGGASSVYILVTHAILSQV
jgi:hypothetical protein